MSVDSPPHSRWLIRESVDRLAASHDEVTVAVNVLARSAVVHRATPLGPTLPQRIAGRRGWARTVWFGSTTLLTGLLLAWISVGLVQHLSAAPGAVAVLPGVLLTLALSATALQAAKHIERPLETGPSAAARLWLLLLAAAAVGAMAWIILWLVLTTGTAAWAAFICGVALVAAVVAGMLAVARPVRAVPAVRHRAGPLPRRLRAQRRRAQRRLRDHTRDWNLTAHQYGAVTGSDAAANALACLLADDADPPLDGIDPYNTLILSALRRYHPAPLSASFDAAVRQLNDVGSQTTGQHLVGTPS